MAAARSRLSSFSSLTFSSSCLSSLMDLLSDPPLVEYVCTRAAISSAKVAQMSILTVFMAVACVFFC